MVRKGEDVAPHNQRLNRLFKAGFLLFCLAGVSRLFLHAIPHRIPAIVIESVIDFLYGISVVLLVSGWTIKQTNGDCLKAGPLEEQ